MDGLEEWTRIILMMEKWGDTSGRDQAHSVYSEWSHLNFMLDSSMFNKFESPGESAGHVRSRLFSYFLDRGMA